MGDGTARKVAQGELTLSRRRGINPAVAPHRRFLPACAVTGMGCGGIGTERKTKHERTRTPHVFRVVVAILPLSLMVSPATLQGQTSSEVRARIQQSGHTE